MTPVVPRDDRFAAVARPQFPTPFGADHHWPVIRP